MSHTTLLLLPRAFPSDTEGALYTYKHSHTDRQTDKNAQGMHAGESSYQGEMHWHQCIDLRSTETGL